MASRGRYNQSQSNEWDSRDDYNSSVYEASNMEDDSSADTNLDHCRLYIRNIPKALNEEGLRAAFAKFGTLVEVFQSKDPQKNFALVRYETAGEAKLAMMKMNRTEPLKLQITIAYKGNKERANRDGQERNATGGRERTRSERSIGRDREEGASVVSRSRASRFKMPRVYKTKEGSKKREHINKDSLKLAVHDVIYNNKSLRGTAKSYKLSVMTLKRYVAKKRQAIDTGSSSPKYEPNYKQAQYFSKEEELDLSNYLETASKQLVKKCPPCVGDLIRGDQVS